jgi:hypothetical protein
MAETPPVHGDRIAGRECSTPQRGWANALAFGRRLADHRNVGYLKCGAIAIMTALLAVPLPSRHLPGEDHLCCPLAALPH